MKSSLQKTYDMLVEGQSDLKEAYEKNVREIESDTMFPDAHEVVLEKLKKEYDALNTEFETRIVKLRKQMET